MLGICATRDDPPAQENQGSAMRGQSRPWADKRADREAGGQRSGWSTAAAARRLLGGKYLVEAEALYSQSSSKRSCAMGRFRWWRRMGVAPLGALLALVLGASVAFADSAHFIKTSAS